MILRPPRSTLFPISGRINSSGNSAADLEMHSIFICKSTLRARRPSLLKLEMSHLSGEDILHEMVDYRIATAQGVVNNLHLNPSRRFVQRITKRAVHYFLTPSGERVLHHICFSNGCWLATDDFGAIDIVHQGPELSD